MRACRSSEVDGSIPIPRRTSEPLAAFPRSPQRSYGDLEGVIFCALAATKFGPEDPP